MNNEKGFVMPLVVILSLLFIAMIFHQITQLENDRQFLSERKNDFHHNTLLQMASIDLLPILENIDTIENMDGRLQYDTGMVTYKIKENRESSITVQLTSTTDQTGKREVFFIYDKTKKTISDWTE